MRIGLLVTAVAIAALGIAIGIAYEDRIVPGVRIESVDVGGLTPLDARDAVERHVGGQELILVADESRIRLDAAAGITIDVDAAVRSAMAIGRHGSVLRRGGDIIGAVTSGRDVPAMRAVVDATRFAATLDLVATSIERPAQDGDVRITATGVTVRDPAAGVVVDRAALVTAIIAARGVAPTVEVPTRWIQPDIDRDAMAEAATAARNASMPLVLTAGGERAVVQPERMLAILSVTHESGADGAALAVSPAGDGLDALVADVAAALDGPVRDAVLVPGGERLAVIAGRDGVAVDRTALRMMVADAIVGLERTREAPATVEHPALTTAAAQRASDTLVLAGSYTTYFPVNPARATNIGAAARTFDGVVVEAGDTFSFWDRIGEVSPRTGYVFAGTIIGGVSSEAIGGGLCQVSTTLFNAVARGGYRIDERHEHSYFIERYPLGLDAAVFAPSTDLRWTNDTPHQAVIRTEGTATSVSFWIYAPPLGRDVSFTEPVEWNVRWPSASQPADPGHVPGYVVAGRDTVVRRTVVQDGTVIRRDEWYSHYDPVWGGPAR